MVPNITDERLRTFLDGNQFARERLCLGVMALDSRFDNVQPRNPRGGPDSGRDLEATSQYGQLLWGAVGFQNSVTDSTADKRQAKKKCTADAKRALEVKPDLKDFVFFTNVSFTADERTKLLDTTLKLGFNFVDIYDRERIRIALDAPDGLALRYQYLGLALSDAEQAAFFSKWGSSIETLISDRVSGLESRLSRLEFLAEAQGLLETFTFRVDLSRECKRDELKSFRVHLHVEKSLAMDPPPILVLTLTEDQGLLPQGAKPREDQSFGAAFVGNTTDPVQRTISLFPSPYTCLIYTARFRSELGEVQGLKLKDLNGTLPIFYINPEIEPLVSRITLFANGYILFSSDRQALKFVAHPYKGVAGVLYQAEQIQSGWRRIMFRGLTLNFDTLTPRKVKNAGLLENPFDTENPVQNPALTAYVDEHLGRAALHGTRGKTRGVRRGAGR